MKAKHWLAAVVIVAAILRLYKIDTVPVSLFGDELDVGYHAYSIAQTGRDYYGNFMPLHFHSLAEWRTPLYLYSAVPTVAIFGVSPLGVRLPAAIFGILTIIALYYLVRELTKNKNIALVSSAVLAVSPWHIQYSRAAFEVTQLILFLVLGVYFFLYALRTKKYLWLSAIFFGLTPWVYSTAKLFAPLLLTAIVLIYRKDLVKLKTKKIATAFIMLLIVAGPMIYVTFFGGGAQRFGYISVFTDPTMETEIGTSRLRAADVRGDLELGYTPKIADRLFHNKYTYWGEALLTNYFQAFSTEFLFNSGDPNPRHSISGVGQFYRIEALALLLGVVFLFTSKINLKHKLLVGLWLLLAPVPSAITREGGNHATRLILMLAPFVFLISYGLWAFSQKIKKYKLAFLGVYISILLISVAFYLWNYYVHNPWHSERWWHAGYKEAIQYVKSHENEYDTVVISTAHEPPWIFFAGWYEYPPRDWQLNFPQNNIVPLDNFGLVSHIDKFYFGSPIPQGIYSWGEAIDSNLLYLATAKEVNLNLIEDPARVPGDLKLLKSIAYPSGEPAFYLFTGAQKE